jgi:heme oxygenase
MQFSYNSAAFTHVTQQPRHYAAASLQDLAHLLGPDWRSCIPASAAAAAYAAHLEQLAAANPALLLPCAFSLYVPILLGFMARRIQQSLQLPDEQGLSFFTVSGSVNCSVKCNMNCSEQQRELQCTLHVKCTVHAAAATLACSQMSWPPGVILAAAYCWTGPKLHIKLLHGTLAALSGYVPSAVGVAAYVCLCTLPLLALLFSACMQIPDKAGKLAQLRAAVTQAGTELPNQQLRQALVSEAVEQFRRNNAVVAEFKVGWRAVLLAVQLVLRRLLKPAGLAVAVVVALLAVAAAAGVLPVGLFARQ